MEEKRLLRRASMRRSLQQVGVAVMDPSQVKELHRPHRHDIIELLVMRQGLLSHEIAGHRFRSRPGCVDLVPPGLAHRYAPESRVCRINNVICDPLQCPDAELSRQLAELAATICGVSARRACQIRIAEHEELFLLVDRMAREQRGDRLAWQSSLRSWYRIFVLQLCRSLAQGKVSWGERGGQAEIEPRLALLRMAIDDHPQRDWNLERVASELGLSREQACRRFSAAFGRSPMSYVGECRLRLAQDLLQHGRGIADAAISAGFPSRAAMHRAFVKQLGCSPRDWRNGKALP